MRGISSNRESILSEIHVLDGGLASELEYLGVNIDGPLWSAHVLEEAPDQIIAVHRSYIEAGAQIIETAGYQVSRMGYAEAGLDPFRADSALLRSVALARRAASLCSDRRVVIAASLGPYGAALHNGAEYHGNYDCTLSDLIEFHRQRIDVLASALPSESADLLAFETLPSLAEAEAIMHALSDHAELAVWFSFTCRDGQHVAHGELIQECAQAVVTLPQTVAIGINCTHPTHVTSLIGELCAVSELPIIVYPNSGEGWDAKNRCWTGDSNSGAYADLAKEWFAAGAQIIGGCCRTRPADIHLVAQAVTKSAGE